MTVEFTLNANSVPEVMIDGAPVPIVSCSYQFFSVNGKTKGINMFIATILIGGDNDLCGPTQLVICHNNLTGETYFQ